MYVITYKLPGREKTFTGPTIPATHKLFIKDYAEAVGEVKKVKIEKSEDLGFLIILNYETFRDFFAKPKEREANNGN
jgi:hypothetical protein